MDGDKIINVPNLIESQELNTTIDEKKLCSGIFWIISDSSDLSEYKLLMFDIPCDTQGNAVGGHLIPLNSKSGGTYNHKKLWDNEVKNISDIRVIIDNSTHYKCWIDRG